MKQQYESEIIAEMCEMLKKSNGHIEAEADGPNMTISGSSSHGFSLMLIDCFIEDMIEEGLTFEDCLYLIRLMRKIRKECENEQR